MARPILLDDDELAAALRVLRGEAIGWTARESGAARRAVAKLEAAQVGPPTPHLAEDAGGFNCGDLACRTCNPRDVDAPKEA